jgi:hypothetical protein
MTATTPATIQAQIAAALQNRTDCGERVYTPSTWPTRPDMMPVVLVRYAASDRSAAGRGERMFTAVDTFQIILQVAQLAAGDDAAVLAAEVTAWRIWRQVEVAVISDPELLRKTSQFPFIRNAIARDSEGQQTLVGMNAELGVEYFQGPEDFLAYDGEDIPGEPLLDLAEVRIDSRQGGLDADDLEAGPIASAVTLAT